MDLNIIRNKYKEDYQKYNNIFKKYVDKYNCKHIDLLIDFKCLFCVLVVNTELSILDIDNQIRDLLNLSDPLSTQLYKDLRQYFIKEYFNKIESKNVNKIISKYNNKYEEVEERMFYRVNLYKEGWNIIQIEKYINKYITKTNSFELEMNDMYERMYNNILYTLGFERIIYKQEVGRPRLSLDIKKYLKEKNREKMKKIMSIKYEKYNKLETNLLTKEEFDSLQDKNIDSSILNKMKNFIKE